MEHYHSLSLPLICTSAVWTWHLKPPWQTKTVISALCSLCFTSDCPFSYFLSFILFNSSSIWSISPESLLCLGFRSPLYLLIPLWLVELNGIKDILTASAKFQAFCVFEVRKCYSSCVSVFKNPYMWRGTSKHNFFFPIVFSFLN